MLFCAFVHETGHLLAARLLRVRAVSLDVGLFGGTIIFEKRLVSYRKDVCIALSGVAMNLIFMAAFFVLLRRNFTADLFFLFLSNGFYAIFNLLPLTNLDGGKALFSLIANKKELYTAYRITAVLSRITLFALGSFSLWLMSVSSFNVSLFVLTLLLYSESTGALN